MFWLKMTPPQREELERARKHVQNLTELLMSTTENGRVMLSMREEREELLQVGVGVCVCVHVH